MTEDSAMRLFLVGSGGALDALAASVRAMGYEVRVGDWITALESVRVGFADVLVLDLDTRDGDPVVFLKDVRDLPHRRKPLIVATAEGTHRPEATGLHIVLTKPIDLAVLAGVLRRFRELLSSVGAFNP